MPLMDFTGTVCWKPKNPINMKRSDDAIYDFHKLATIQKISVMMQFIHLQETIKNRKRKNVAIHTWYRWCRLATFKSHET